MAANPNWPRWVFASIAKHLKAAATTATYPVMVEGLDDRSEQFLTQKLRTEIRINGPFFQQRPGEWFMWVDANVLITANMDGPHPYELTRAAGVFLEAITTPIQVWNYGNLAGDFVQDDPSTQVFLGCLQVRGGKESVGVFHFGQIDKTDRVRQALVDASLEMTLEQ